VDGQVARWSFDTISPFTYLNRVPWYRDSAWLMPAVITAIGIVLLSGLAWPAGAIARRRFKVAGRYEGRRLRNQRILHGWQWLVLLVLAGWAAWITVGLGSLSMLAGPLDPLLYALQVLSPIALFGLPVLAGWNLWTARREKRGWFGLLWGGLLLLAAVILLWMALAFHMFGFGTHY
jgi:hypothetical protein